MQRTENNNSKEEEVEDLIPSNFKMYYKATVIKIDRYGTTKQNREFIDRTIKQNQLIFYKRAKAI